MILRFVNFNESRASRLNIDTTREEFSDEKIPDKNYIHVSQTDYERLLQELDFNCFAQVKQLQTDCKSINDEDCLPFEVAVDD